MHNKIYALCDAELLKRFNFGPRSCGVPPVLQYLQHIKQYIKQNDIIYIQYRDKINSLDIQKQNILLLKENTDIPIIINDNIELLEFCDGLHLGQEDIEKIVGDDKNISIKFIRKKYPNKIIGLSTHNELEILEANNLDLDYIGLGAYRSTSTKDVSNILGENISYLAKISIHPVGAIGGVKLEDKIPNISYNVIGSGLLK
ncbi:MAG: thiamine phosphate synthase [Campylobacterota bacterium]|nr:thiamine phosphate synthase [Campylobacterota bacterium]